MVKADPNGKLYGPIIDRNIEKIFRMGLDLKPYFNSPLAFYEISNVPSYPTYHTDNTEVLTHSSLSNLI